MSKVRSARSPLGAECARYAGTELYKHEGQPFDQEFKWILNVAVGGSYFSNPIYGPFRPEDVTKWKKPTMEVDWVRVYQRVVQDVDQNAVAPPPSPPPPPLPTTIKPPITQNITTTTTVSAVVNINVTGSPPDKTTSGPYVVETSDDFDQDYKNYVDYVYYYYDDDKDKSPHNNNPDVAYYYT